MTRGRKAQPDEIKELRGNPGKRRLVALEAAKKAQRIAPAQAPVIETPSWLNNDREIAIFRSVVDEYQQNRIARKTDVAAYARWAHYLRRWIEAKEQLGDSGMYYKVESNHGSRLALHPLLVVMFRCEAEITKQEDRLGLNPAARHVLNSVFLDHAVKAGMTAAAPAATAPPSASSRTPTRRSSSG